MYDEGGVVKSTGPILIRWRGRLVDVGQPTQRVASLSLEYLLGREEV